MTMQSGINTMFRSRGWLAVALALQVVLLYLFYKIPTSNQCVAINRASCDSNSHSSSSVDWSVTDQSNLKLVKWQTVKATGRLGQDLDYSVVKKLAKPDAKDMNDKWVVITTINRPTKDVEILASMKGWRVVVVGDKKTPPDWSHPNCVFLSVERQKELGYQVIKYLPFNNYPRKSVGYVYAIHHGAKFIYDTDDDNHPYDGKLNFFDKGKGEFYVYNTDKLVVNPLQNLGQTTMWPRGYPLTNISDPIEKTFTKCKNVEATIQQGVVDGDPDLDAIFRLTRKDSDVMVDVKFDASAPPMLLPPGTMTPYNSQNTFFLENALWSLYLPVTPTFRVTDIWRGYWTQRLLWEIGGHLAYYPPNAYQYRNAHSYHSDFIEEHGLYHDAGRLVRFLVQWKSDRKDLFGKAIDLTISMIDKRFLEPLDALAMEAWVYDLVSVGYKMPKLNPTPRKCQEVSVEKVVIEPKEQPSTYLTARKKLIKINP